MNNAILLQIQEKKAKEMELNSKATYDNISFENHEKSNGEIPIDPTTTQESSEFEIDIL